MYDEILQAVIGMAEQATGKNIVVGSNPPKNSIAMTGSGAPSTIFLDIGSNERMSILCNAKNESQQAVINQLDAIHAALTRRKDYPSTGNWQIYSIETVASPRLIGVEQNPRSAWIYGSSLLVKFNTKGI